MWFIWSGFFFILFSISRTKRLLWPNHRIFSLTFSLTFDCSFDHKLNLLHATFWSNFEYDLWSPKLSSPINSHFVRVYSLKNDDENLRWAAWVSLVFFVNFHFFNIYVLYISCCQFFMFLLKYIKFICHWPDHAVRFFHLKFICYVVVYLFVCLFFLILFLFKIHIIFVSIGIFL